MEDGIAAKAGIKRGSKVHSINGNTMSGLTHAQSVSILKVSLILYFIFMFYKFISAAAAAIQKYVQYFRNNVQKL